jgi:hypothetical protein
VQIGQYWCWVQLVARLVSDLAERRKLERNTCLQY